MPEVYSFITSELSSDQAMTLPLLSCFMSLSLFEIKIAKIFFCDHCRRIIITLILEFFPAIDLRVNDLTNSLPSSIAYGGKRRCPLNVRWHS